MDGMDDMDDMDGMGWKIPPFLFGPFSLQHLKPIHCPAVTVLRLQWLRTILADQAVDVSGWNGWNGWNLHPANRNPSDQI